MQSETAQEGLRRLVTGAGCEVLGCYEVAVWVVTVKDERFHWCAKHTRTSMRDAARWRTKVPEIRSRPNEAAPAAF